MDCCEGAKHVALVSHGRLSISLSVFTGLYGRFVELKEGFDST